MAVSNSKPYNMSLVGNTQLLEMQLTICVTRVNKTFLFD